MGIFLVKRLLSNEDGGWVGAQAKGQGIPMPDRTLDHVRGNQIRLPRAEYPISEDPED